MLCSVGPVGQLVFTKNIYKNNKSIKQNKNKQIYKRQYGHKPYSDWYHNASTVKKQQILAGGD